MQGPSIQAQKRRDAPVGMSLSDEEQEGDLSDSPEPARKPKPKPSKTPRGRAGNLRFGRVFLLPGAVNVCPFYLRMVMYMSLTSSL